MTDGTRSAIGKDVELVESGGRRARRWWAIALVLVVAAASAAAVWFTGVLDGDDSSGSRDDGSGTSLATVQRQTLSTQQQFNGTLGYAGSYTVLGQVQGTVTWLPRVGQVVRQGHVLYRVDGAPAVLLYGAAPAYRTLAEGAHASDLKGRDVAQLNHDLVALGYVDATDVDAAWNEFNWATRLGVAELQDHLGVEQDGRLELGEVVFLPTAARVTSLRAVLGAPAAGPVLQASSTVHTVTVALATDLRSTVKEGDRVTVTLPDDTTTPGRVTSIGRVASIPSNNPDGQVGSESGPTVPVHIGLAHPRAAGSLDQTPVQVEITDQTVRNVLAVDVTALLARAGGGYAVEVVDDDGSHHLVPVKPGLFDDAEGLVQVSGSGVRAGQHVVVAGE
jgi:hypothetical protein